MLWGTTIRPNQDYKMCLDLENGDPSKGTEVQLWTCNGLVNQQWVYDPKSGAIIYGNGGIPKQACLDAGGLKEGNRLMVWDCNNQPQQQWGYDQQMMTLYLRSSAAASSGADATLCVDFTGGTLAPGSGVELWGCNGESVRRLLLRSPMPRQPLALHLSLGSAAHSVHQTLSLPRPPRLLESEADPGRRHWSEC